MSSMPVMPRDTHSWTVDDLDRLPDDGLQYELLDGILLVSPGPVKRHQIVASRLHRLLDDACPAGLLALFAPFDWRPDRRTSLQPDLLVVPDEHYDETSTEKLLLAVEILSPSTRSKDLVWKRQKYESAGVPVYLIVDPEGPAVTALELVNGRYVVAGEAKADEQLTLSHPFDLSVTPAALVAARR
jgi:Uma2 family endonuclease